MKSNADLQHEVLEELQVEPGVKATTIGVTAEGRVVTLTGYVDSFPAKWAAENAVKRVVGVKGIANELEVRLPAFWERTDTEIAQAAVNALEWDVYVPLDCITVKVENGWLTLDGEVESQFQKNAAVNTVRNLAGVKGLTNLIAIKKPTVTPANVKAQIEKALLHSAEVDAARIMVEARDGKVILHGCVRSLLEREEAERATWAVPGVTVVENRILIEP